MEILIPIFAIALTFAVPIFFIWTRHRQKIAEMQIQATSQLTAEKAAQYASHNRELEERLRVLERIVTDKGYDVATQIEALRDQHRIEDHIDAPRDPAVN